MAKKLSDKILYLQELIRKLHAETTTALLSKNVSTSDDQYKVKDSPDLIRLIRTTDFLFRFDFKYIDSVGTIHSRNEGASTGGMRILPVPVNFSIHEKIDFKTVTPIVKALSGVYGQTSTIFVNCVFPTVTSHAFDFKVVDSAPEQFIPSNEEEE